MKQSSEKCDECGTQLIYDPHLVCPHCGLMPRGGFQWLRDELALTYRSSISSWTRRIIEYKIHELVVPDHHKLVRDEVWFIYRKWKETLQHIPVNDVVLIAYYIVGRKRAWPEHYEVETKISRGLWRRFSPLLDYYKLYKRERRDSCRRVK